MRPAAPHARHDAPPDESAAARRGAAMNLLQRVAELRATAPSARRAILDLVLEDPDRVLEESF